MRSGSERNFLMMRYKLRDRAKKLRRRGKIRARVSNRAVFSPRRRCCRCRGCALNKSTINWIAIHQGGGARHFWRYASRAGDLYGERVNNNKRKNRRFYSFALVVAVAEGFSLFVLLSFMVIFSGRAALARENWARPKGKTRTLPGSGSAMKIHVVQPDVSRRLEKARFDYLRFPCFSATRYVIV